MKIKFNSNNNQIVLHMLGLVLLIRIIIDFINCVEVKFSISSNGATIVYNIMILLIWFTIIKHKYFSVKGLAIYLGLFFILLTNSLLFRYMEYFRTFNITMVFLLFLPFAIFIIPQIHTWDNAIEILSGYCIIGISLDIIGILFLDYLDLSMYMSYSFGLLPFLIISYTFFRTKKKELRRYWHFVLFIIGSITLIFLSSRSVILFLILYLIIFELLNTQSIIQFLKKAYLLIFSILVLIIADINTNEILEKLFTVTNSRTLNYMLNSNLFDSDGRDEISTILIMAINSMGLKGYGIFGDRYLLQGLWGQEVHYAHNIILEVLVNFGVIFGSLLLIGLFYSICKAFVKADYNTKNIVAIFTVSLFLRYFVSGSYVIEGNFYVYIAIITSILHSKQNDNRVLRKYQS